MIESDLTGQVALVTGAGRGIGEAIARAYAGAGAAVVLVARTASEVEAVAADIEANGGSARACPGDVSDHAAMIAAVDEAATSFGRLDIVVANAGALAAPAPKDAIDDFGYVLDVNVVSVHMLARLAEPALRVRGGTFIVMGSGAGHRPFPGNLAYSVSKAAASMLVRNLAVEWRRASIAVHEIVPGPVHTTMAGSVFGDPTGTTSLPAEVRSEWFKQPADVVPLALFLAGLPNGGPSGQTYSLLGRDL